MYETLLDSLERALEVLKKIEEKQREQKEPIKIWKFEDAPQEYRDIVNKDDADWLALVPLHYKNEYLPFLEEPVFGCCYVRYYPVADGIIVVGYHA